MSQICNKIDKAFILAGGKGNRINLGQKENIKAFIEIDNEQLLKRHIRLINENLKPKKIYIVITKFEKFFKENIQEFNNVELIINDNVSNQKGLELLLAIKNINKIIDKNEKILLTLVDEYYDDFDFKNFCSAIFNKNFTTMVAIKKLNFPDEYLKNYAVTLDMEKEIIINSVEKSKEIISNFFGTGLICIDKNFTEFVAKNLEDNIKTPLFSLFNKSQVSKYHVLDNIYSNINTRVDIYELEKKIRKNKKFKIDVIIPAYLEEANISFVVNDFKKVVDNVIVANKISEDRTEIIAKSNGAKVISDNYLGYGHAIRSGIKYSNADIIVLAEADGTFRSSDLEKLLNCLMDNDVVQGTRTNPAYIQYKANMDRPRIFFNKLFGNFISNTDTCPLSIPCINILSSCKCMFKFSVNSFIC